jgi:hypothetical protein
MIAPDASIGALHAFLPVENESRMLRITHSGTETEQRWTLCGQLTGPWVAELRACWEHGRQAAMDAHAVVDLSDVTFIDESGAQLLSDMRSGGTEFVAGGVDTEHLLKDLKTKGERPLRRFIGAWAGSCRKSENTKKEERK